MSRTRNDLRFIAAVAIAVAMLTMIAVRLARTSPDVVVIRIGDGPPTATVAVVDTRPDVLAGRTDDVEDLPASVDDPVIDRAIRLRGDGRTYEAIGVLEDDRTTAGDRPESLSELGSMLLSVGRTAAAIEVLRRAIELAPDIARTHYNIGIAFASVGDRNAAVAAYERAVELRPNHARAWFNLGMLRLEQDDLAGAEDAFLHVTRVDRTARAAKAFFQLGVVLRRVGRPEDALEAYRDAIRIRPDYAEARNNLALTLEDTGDTESAIRELEKGVRLDPGVASLSFNLGRLYRNRGDLDAAIGAFEGATAADPGLRKAHVALGETLERAGRPADAATAFERALELRHDDTELRVDLARLYRELERLDLAEDHLERVVLDRPQYASAWNALGIVRAQDGRNKEAITCYEHAIALDAEGTAARYNRALALERLGLTQDASEAFRSVLDRDPRHVGARERLARSWLVLGEDDRARDEAVKLGRLAGDDPAILFDAAVILSRSGHPDEAIPFWNRILEANPGHAQALLNLGVAHAKAGRDELAIEAYERLLILRPDDAQVLRYLERARARLSDSTTAPGRTPAGKTRSVTEGVLVP